MTVLEVLAKEGPLRPAEIAARVGKRPASIRAYLARLVKEGIIIRLGDGTYALPADIKDDTTDAPAGGQEPADAGARRHDPYAMWTLGFYDGLQEVGPGWPLNKEAAQGEVRRALAELGLDPTAGAVDGRAAREVYLRGLDEGRKARTWWLEKERREREERQQVYSRNPGLAWLLGADENFWDDLEAASAVDTSGRQAEDADGCEEPRAQIRRACREMRQMAVKILL